MRHTHFGWDGRIDGVRYVQAALATPHERARRPASLAVGDFYPGTGSLAPICVFEASRGLPAPWRAAWSDHYARAPRAPSDTRPAPWVVEHVGGAACQHALAAQAARATRARAIPGLGPVWKPVQ
uniref:Uncharacterized protein n=1 Tax=Calcidiscus leptoporus TaxID=127549 RepID=A0A7S0NSL9_9EUKA|mmetsp:Transcript_22138/g.50877  ORF Transcript_22138/g.50877 Transcript_22138/m.50877 type:complete len:125 (+) Transcript_22138:517-891(+)